MDIKGRESLRQLKDKLQAINVGTETYTLVASASDGNTRAAVFEVEGGTFDKAWLKLEKKLAKFIALPNWLRVDLITEEKPLNYEELTRYFLSIKRNNYINRGFRIKGSRPHLFLKEELVGNAILKPDKNHKMGFNLPNLEIDERNYAGYVNRKYNILEPSLNYLKTSTFGLFKTQGFFIEHHQIIPLENYGNGNEVRLFGKESITRCVNYKAMANLFTAIIQRIINRLKGITLFVIFHPFTPYWKQWNSVVIQRNLLISVRDCAGG